MHLHHETVRERKVPPCPGHREYLMLQSASSCTTFGAGRFLRGPFLLQLPLHGQGQHTSIFERAVFTSSTCGHMRPEFQGNVLAVMVGEGNI
eukprot:symbB.v1.2.037968.t1/scaffold5253.1/size30222/3